MRQPEPPHDVLAAEEFALPAPDPRLHQGPVRLPEDPTGIAEPHDVLAAEEFALPAPISASVGPTGVHSAGRHRSRRLIAGAGAALLAARLARRVLRIGS